MKKAAAILLAGVMAFGLIGCGGTQTSGSGQAEGAAQESRIKRKIKEKLDRI